MLIENIKFLNNTNRDLRELMKKYENEENRDSSVELITSKNGLPTIRYNDGLSKLFLHSKYDPLKESDRIYKKYESSISNCENILFFGVGMGYHIQFIMEKYPNHRYFLFEPNPTILYQFLSVHSVKETFSAKKYQLYTADNEVDQRRVIKDISEQICGSIFLISHPSYERIFKKEYHSFLTDFNEFLKAEITNVKVKVSFQKQWLFNSVKNIKHTLNCPNVLLDIDKKVFKGKPVIIASAGPSLIDELDTLRKIKKEGLAYIFAVGSANKVLIKNNIEPDAVCTYDPQAHNYKVFEEMIESGISHIPMIYGTTVGYETLEKYKGPKFHVVISQDKLTPYLLKDHRENVEVLDDAPSIAIVMLQMLNKLDASPIILAGQNFAYRDQDFYAEGIEYVNRTQKLTQNDQKKVITVESVFGQDIYTSEGFFRMKETMEKYLNIWSREDVINTTAGGATIKGTTFMPLKDVVTKYLTEKVVNNHWHTLTNQKQTDINLIIKFKNLERHHSFHKKTIRDLKKTIKDIDFNVRSSWARSEQKFIKLDSLVSKLESNDFYKIFIKPIVQVEHEQIVKVSRELKFVKDVNEKATKIVESFGKFVNTVDVNTSYIEPVFFELKTDFGV
ncbi:hypothetical protein CR203_07610 [Salipaludibacillus neizhouensis]|uniref:Motility associated factor glycosyltransferase family protein n=1 Tax=Salipaludibacillus neizhouensis TaxID=885475 RepID=A0A3A9K9U2_9BACI|nr:6-hydroxymethylpterin diphosphokinase MptE-like protein [Salipaludibacillus neizhouensis]RKL68338.1 hypothetical protein CR203_07610 [Salipaludibacillus neizhouensis]